MYFVGAASAFGITTLLPLNVPVEMPLMNCNETISAQIPVKLRGEIYSCGADNAILISCPRTTFGDRVFDECRSKNQKLPCDSVSVIGPLFCENSTLYSVTPIVCESTSSSAITFIAEGTTMTVTETILNCFYGQFPDPLASFVPTTEEPVTDKSLSLGAKIHVFLLTIMGKNDVLNAEASEIKQTQVLPPNATPWIPEALTIPPGEEISIEESLEDY